MSANQRPRVATELLNTLTNVDGSPRKDESFESEQLVSRMPLPRTPFEIIGKEGKGFFLAMGKFKLSKEYDTEMEVANALSDDMWDILGNMITCIVWELEQRIKSGEVSVNAIKGE